MTDFNSHRPDGEPTADRWAGALRLFDGLNTPESPADKWERANLLFGEKQYANAAGLLADLVEQFPTNNAARALLARAYYHSAQLRRAEEQLRILIERDPVDDYAHLMLGRCLERQGRAPEGAPWLRMADALTSGTAEDDED